MKQQRDFPEKNKKIEGLKYALLADKIELPVLDITHPLFVSEHPMKRSWQAFSRTWKKRREKGRRVSENAVLHQVLFFQAFLCDGRPFSERKDGRVSERGQHH
ncbi:MAG: hypothetical protein M0C28_32180 [Candidatus Moduliflexus flocculans]|nr:hypothetical protein [Candidatus Moduliflexus flocculans]